MGNLDTTDSVTRVWILWRIVGIHPYKRLQWLYYIYAVFVNLTASVISPALVFINVFMLEDVGKIMDNLQASITLMFATLKHFVVFLRISDLHKVEPYLNQLDHRASFNNDEVRYLENVIKQCRRIPMVFVIAFIFSLSSFTIPGYLNRRLVFEGWFPFDWTSSQSLYLFAFLFQFIGATYQIAQNGANDAYPAVYINVLMGHYHVLRMRVSRIGYNLSTSPMDNYKELISCIIDHKNILSIFESVKRMIGYTLLIQFIVTALVLCLSGVHYFVFNREVGQLIGSCIYGLAIMLETFPVCYFGNALMEEADMLTNAIYNCNWMDQSIKFRKCLIIFMQRTQKPNVIKAGLTTVTLQTFIAVIRFSFSLFTLLAQTT